MLYVECGQFQTISQVHRLQFVGRELCNKKTKSAERSVAASHFQHSQFFLETKVDLFEMNAGNLRN